MSGDTTPTETATDRSAVPDSSGAAGCSFCGDAFPTDRLRDLHRGLEHYERLDEDERAAYEAAYRSESEDLRSFRLRALAVLVLLYFGFLMTYAVVAV